MWKCLTWQGGRWSWGKSQGYDWFFIGQDFAIRTVSMEMVISCVFFCFRKPENSKQAWQANILQYGPRAWLVRGYYWIFIQTKLSSIYRHKPIFTYWALMKRHALLTIWAKLRLAILKLKLFFTFRSRRPWRNTRKRVIRGGKPWSPETLLFNNYSMSARCIWDDR